jgi:hypothetical protein
MFFYSIHVFKISCGVGYDERGGIVCVAHIASTSGWFCPRTSTCGRAGITYPFLYVLLDLIIVPRDMSS